MRDNINTRTVVSRTTNNTIVIEDYGLFKLFDHINGAVIFSAFKKYEYANKISFGLLLGEENDDNFKFTISTNLALATDILKYYFPHNPGVKELPLQPLFPENYYNHQEKTILPEPLAHIPQPITNRKRKRPYSSPLNFLDLLQHAYLDFAGVLHTPIPFDMDIESVRRKFYDKIRRKNNAFPSKNPIILTEKELNNHEIILGFDKTPTRLELLNELRFIAIKQQGYIKIDTFNAVINLEHQIYLNSKLRDTRVFNQETPTTSLLEAIQHIPYFVSNPLIDIDLTALFLPDHHKMEVYIFIPKLSYYKATNTALFLDMIILNSDLQNNIVVSSDDKNDIAILNFNNPSEWSKHLTTLFQSSERNRVPFDPKSVIIKYAVCISLKQFDYTAQQIATTLQNKLLNSPRQNKLDLTFAIDADENKLVLLFDPATAELQFNELFLLVTQSKQTKESRLISEQNNHSQYTISAEKPLSYLNYLIEQYVPTKDLIPTHTSEQHVTKEEYSDYTDVYDTRVEISNLPRRSNYPYFFSPTQLQPIEEEVLENGLVTASMETY